MFSVEYNQLQYRNHFGSAIINGFDEEEEISHGSHSHEGGLHSDEEEEDQVALLFERMYQYEDFYSRLGRAHSFANDALPMWISDGIHQIRGTMSDRGKAIIKLNITTQH